MNVVSSIERDISNWDTVCFGWWMGLHCYCNWNWNWEILLGNPFPQSLHTFRGFEFHTGREYWLNIGFCLSRELQWKLFHSLCVSEYGWIYSQWQSSAWILLIFFHFGQIFKVTFFKTRKQWRCKWRHEMVADWSHSRDYDAQDQNNKLKKWYETKSMAATATIKSHCNLFRFTAYCVV